MHSSAGARAGVHLQLLSGYADGFGARGIADSVGLDMLAQLAVILPYVEKADVGGAGSLWECRQLARGDQGACLQCVAERIA